MLVLTRREGEDVLIRVPGLANPIRVRVVAIRGERIRLAFTADKSITIDREEVDEQKRTLEAATYPTPSPT